MTETEVMPQGEGLGATARRDPWWLAPVGTALGLGAFIVYSTWAAFQGRYFEYGPYLSPFYSPNLSSVFPWWKLSPAFLILWAPGGFRATCYYYRKAYYRAYFLDPPACAVGEPSDRAYRGETAFPFILQNLHRYFFYLAFIFIFILGYDAIRSFNFDGKFGVGVGSLVLTGNVILLSCYTFGCHSLRHLIGGRLDCFTCPGASLNHKLRCGVSVLNERHMLWAWCSLFSGGFADVYVRLCAMGIWRDVRIF